MTQAAGQLLEQVMRLDPADRAELIDRAFASDDGADGPPDDGYDAAWAAELRVRQAEVERGDETPVPWREAMARIRRGQVDVE